MLLICLCIGGYLMTVRSVIETNSTPATNKVVILDARAPESRIMAHKVQMGQQSKN